MGVIVILAARSQIEILMCSDLSVIVERRNSVVCTKSPVILLCLKLTLLFAITVAKGVAADAETSVDSKSNQTVGLSQSALTGVHLQSTRQISADYSSQPRELSATVRSGITVDEFAKLHRSRQLKRRLLAQGARQTETPLGAVIIFAERETFREGRFVEIKALLESTLPDVFAQVASVLEVQHFPSNLGRDASYPWQIFLERSPIHSHGMLSSQRCHAVWMGPPANFFLSVDGFFTNCGSRTKSRSEAGKELRGLLVHEVAHALEFRLMGKGFSRRQRWHSEGFASWFETLHPEWNQQGKKQEFASLFVRDWNPVQFSGTRSDYARSYAFIAALIHRTSVEQLLAIYNYMDAHEVPFEFAVHEILGWNLSRWNQVVRNWVEVEGQG